MKKYTRTLLFFATLICAGPTLAGSNTDRQIESVMADLSRYEQQFAGKPDVNPNSVKRTLKLLGLTRQRLDRVSDHSSPAWQEADNRYKALHTRLNELIQPGGSHKIPPVSPSEAVPSPQQTAEQSGKSVSREMISQHQTRVKKLKRDVDSMFDTMDKAGVKPFQDPKYVQTYLESLRQYKQAIKKYEEFSFHPTVEAAQESIAKLESMIAFGQQQAAKDLKVLGDVQARLRVIHETTKKLKVPATPQVPLKNGEIAQWISELGVVRQTAIQTYQPLPRIQKLAYLPNTRFTVEQTGTYEMDDVKRLDQSLRGLVSQVDSDLKKFSDHLRLNVEEVEKSLSVYEAYDPTKEEDRLKHFLYEGRATQIKQSLATHHILVSEAVTFAQQLKTDDLTAWSKLLQRVENATKHYESKFQQALNLARMPKPVSTDSDLLAIARKALQHSIPPGYDKVGEIKRIVITSKKVHRANDVTHETFDDIDISSRGNITMSGTAITNHFEWDEFKVASAEALGDKHFIYYNSLAYYTQGGTKTPLNRWVVTNRLKGAEIHEKNIHAP